MQQARPEGRGERPHAGLRACREGPATGRGLHPGHKPAAPWRRTTSVDVGRSRVGGFDRSAMVLACWRRSPCCRLPSLPMVPRPGGVTTSRLGLSRPLPAFVLLAAGAPGPACVRPEARNAHRTSLSDFSVCGISKTRCTHTQAQATSPAFRPPSGPMTTLSILSLQAGPQAAGSIRAARAHTTHCTHTWPSGDRSTLAWWPACKPAADAGSPAPPGSGR